MRKTWCEKNASVCYLQTKLSILYHHVPPTLTQVYGNQNRIMQVQSYCSAEPGLRSSLCILYFHISNTGTNRFSSFLRNSLPFSAPFLPIYNSCKSAKNLEIAEPFKTRVLFANFMGLGRGQHLILIQSPTAVI